MQETKQDVSSDLSMKILITKKSAPIKLSYINKTFSSLNYLKLLKTSLRISQLNRGNQIHITVEPDVTVHADYDRLTQILINITKNSIQFTENGDITLRGFVQAENDCD